eukprot:c232_g1_i1.p1 GENE.c232_g1_i1~~c232_g1_i1.p1  ORF type:complete len:368 (-),score=84.87 c232_g1_i1:126-1229(-)
MLTAWRAGTSRRFVSLSLPSPKIDFSRSMEYDCQKTATHITMKELFEFGSKPSSTTLLLASQFLYDELSIRLAQREKQLRDLPHGLAEMSSIIRVRTLYESSYREIKNIPKPRSMAQELQFTELIGDIKDRHRNVQMQVAEGLQELCTQREAARTIDFSKLLDAFYSSRIGIRLLIGQHVALHKPREGFVGVIKTDCRMMFCATMAVDAASELCTHYYGHAPKVVYEGNLDMTFTYIPAHVYYVLFELLKNSFRAVCERHRSGTLPPVKVVFAEGKRDVCVKISDVGGGISREGMAQMWNYTYSTAKISQKLNMTPMAGFGHGLPFSRLYARYFGGNLEVMTMEGYGTDVYVYLNKIGDVIDESPIN